MHLTNKDVKGDSAAVEARDSGSAGAPELIRENGLPGSPVAGEAKLSAESNAIVNPPINLAGKIIEVMRGYKSGSDNFRPIKIDRLD